MDRWSLASGILNWLCFIDYWIKNIPAFRKKHQKHGFYWVLIPDITSNICLVYLSGPSTVGIALWFVCKNKILYYLIGKLGSVLQIRNYIFYLLHLFFLILILLYFIIFIWLVWSTASVPSQPLKLYNSETWWLHKVKFLSMMSQP